MTRTINDVSYSVEVTNTGPANQLGSFSCGPYLGFTAVTMSGTTATAEWNNNPSANREYSLRGMTCTIAGSDTNGRSFQYTFRTVLKLDPPQSPSFVERYNFGFSSGTGLNVVSGIGSVFDTTGPTPAITGLAAIVGLASDQVTIDFGEEVTGFELTDLSLTNLDVRNLQGGANGVYTFDVVATGTGDGSISLPAAAVQDLAGNDNVAAIEVTTDAVATGPEISFVSFVPDPANQGNYVATFDVSDPGGGGVAFTFPPTPIDVTGAFDVTPEFDGPTQTLILRLSNFAGGPVSVRFEFGLFYDLITFNQSAITGPITLGTPDQTPPTPAIEYVGYDLADPFTARITWDEEVTEFGIGDIVAPSADVTNFQEVTPGLVYTVTVQAFDLTTPPEISIPADIAQDLAGNPNDPSPAQVLEGPDGVAPVVTITGVPDGFTGPVTTTITFDWGERVLGFEDSDISVTGGTLGAISGGPDVWTAELSVTGDTDVAVSVAAGAVLDASGTPSVAAFATGAYASGSIAEAVIRDLQKHGSGV